MTRPTTWAALTLGFAFLATPAGADDGTGTALLPPPVLAADDVGAEHLGTVRIFTNDWYGDVIGDRYDRWRTGAVQIGILYGEEWLGVLPSTPFALTEYRLRGEIIAPDNLSAPAAGDRLYAGSWSFGAHTYFGWSGFDVSAGADVVIMGPQTGLMGLHSTIHQVFGNNPIELSDHEIDNGIYLAATAEVGRDYVLSFGALRPFLEVQAGVETLARAGVDVTVGNLGQGGLRVRDTVTGHRVAAINSDEINGGWSVLLGADLAYVAASAFLPEDDGPAPEDLRHRLRVGANYGVGDSNLFYGVSYLSEEFEGQPEGQVVGVLSVDIRF